MYNRFVVNNKLCKDKLCILCWFGLHNRKRKRKWNEEHICVWWCIAIRRIKGSSDIGKPTGLNCLVTSYGNRKNLVVIVVDQNMVNFKSD